MHRPCERVRGAPSKNTTDFSVTELVLNVREREYSWSIQAIMIMMPVEISIVKLVDIAVNRCSLELYCKSMRTSQALTLIEVPVIKAAICACLEV